MVKKAGLGWEEGREEGSGSSCRIVGGDEEYPRKQQQEATEKTRITKRRDGLLWQKGEE